MGIMECRNDFPVVTLYPTCKRGMPVTDVAKQERGGLKKWENTGLPFLYGPLIVFPRSLFALPYLILAENRNKLS